jgi:cyanophycinase-like exopeptidase
MTVLCLQGGNELTSDCRDMDRRLLTRAADGPVVVVPLASEPGADYRRTGDNARRYFDELGTQVVVSPDARRAAEDAAAAVDDAGLLVLTGGSPRRLRDALRDTGLGDRIAARWADGVPVMGASAGAMVACATTLLPAWRADPSTGPGLGLLDDHVVVPHFDGRRGAWVRVALTAAPVVLGIPECSGVLIDGDEMRALGVAATTVITADGRRELPLEG